MVVCLSGSAIAMIVMLCRNSALQQQYAQIHFLNSLTFFSKFRYLLVRNRSFISNQLLNENHFTYCCWLAKFLWRYSHQPGTRVSGLYRSLTYVYRNSGRRNTIEASLVNILELLVPQDVSQAKLLPLQYSCCYGDLLPQIQQLIVSDTITVSNVWRAYNK